MSQNVFNVLDQVSNYIIFKTWFMIFCICELVIYVLASVFVINKLKDILRYRNYLIIIVFGLSLTAEIVFIQFNRKNLDKFMQQSKDISLSDNDDDSKLIIPAVLSFYKQHSWFIFGDYFYLIALYLIILRSNYFWDQVYFKHYNILINSDQVNLNP